MSGENAKLIIPQGIIHVGGFVAIVIVLGVMAPKNTADFVFKDFSNESGLDE